MKVYVEGGGQGKLRGACRSGFSSFFKKAGLIGHMPKVVACGSRDETLKRFRIALNQGRNSGEIPLLLVDSEAPVLLNNSPWRHLRSRDGWQRPASTLDEHAHLMVQCMESWFLADVSTLRRYFGPGFKSTAIPQRSDIERVPKNDVFNQLESASTGSKKGAYDKGSHSFEILGLIDPDKVVERSKFAKRLIDALKNELWPS